MYKIIKQIREAEALLGWSKTPASHFETYSKEEIKEHLRELKKSLKTSKGKK